MTTLRDQWVQACVERSMMPAEFYTGCRKIHTGVTLTFDKVDDTLRIQDAGFTKTKLGMLRRLYWDDDHASKVAELWKGRMQRGKYGSVSVSTYHHITKADPEKRSKRASVMGPCLVGVSFTLMNDKSIAVDAFYRTTELFKKFPADVVFMRDTIIPAIVGPQWGPDADLGEYLTGIKPGAVWSKVSRLRCHFANMTSHPMYAVTWLPLLDEPLKTLELIRASDQRFFDWTIKWTGRYLCDEYHRGIAKFAQALRVQKDARERITGKKLKAMQEYIRDNHPGYRGEYDSEDEDDE